VVRFFILLLVIGLVRALTWISSWLHFRCDVDSDTNSTHHKHNTQNVHKVGHWVANCLENRCGLCSHNIILSLIKLADFKPDIIECVIFTRLCFTILNRLPISKTTFDVFPWSLLLTFLVPNSNTNTAQKLVRVTSGRQGLRQLNLDRVTFTRSKQAWVTSNLFKCKKVDSFLGVAWVPEPFGIISLIALRQSLDMLVLVDLSEWLHVVPFEVEAVGLRVPCWHVFLVKVQWGEVQFVHLILEVVYSWVLWLAQLWSDVAAEFCSEGRFLFSFIHNVHVEFLELTGDQTIRHFYPIKCCLSFPLHLVT